MSKKFWKFDDGSFIKCKDNGLIYYVYQRRNCLLPNPYSYALIEKSELTKPTNEQKGRWKTKEAVEHRFELVDMEKPDEK